MREASFSRTRLSTKGTPAVLALGQPRTRRWSKHGKPWLAVVHANFVKSQDNLAKRPNCPYAGRCGSGAQAREGLHHHVDLGRAAYLEPELHVIDSRVRPRCKAVRDGAGVHW